MLKSEIPISILLVPNLPKMLYPEQLIGPSSHLQWWLVGHLTASSLSSHCCAGWC